MNLQAVTDEQLRDELSRREAARKSAPPPVAIEKPDFSALIACITEGVNEMVKEQRADDNFKSYVYETAMEAVFGRSYWIWRRAQKF